LKEEKSREIEIIGKGKVIVRFVDATNARIQQRLCSLQLLEKSLTGEECAYLLIKVIVEIL
jgi:hypothetical protein